VNRRWILSGAGQTDRQSPVCN